ncbi:hypothetical protein [Paraburkholderia dinghuensis]|uniref:hypothetical protein n=1 Tax=Paraburkholderia dinghuensis TaxID=2305225 RepID=UPI0016233FDE|nr:hypothetical protein [Paraburkholderia dinghuensis]
MSKKNLMLHMLLLLTAHPAFSAECGSMDSAKLARMNPAGLTRYYGQLGEIKNTWLVNSGMSQPDWYAQVQKCDREADRVQQVAIKKHMDLFQLETSGRHTGLLGTDSAAGAQQP